MDRTERDAHRVRESALGGGAAPPPRHEVAASWRRMAAAGLDPGSPPEVPPLTGMELERRRAESGMADLVAPILHYLEPVVSAGQLVVIADTAGRVLWRHGGPAITRDADRLGFVPGSAWTEGNVGTNAIGTALVLGDPVHIRGAEHFVESHTLWGCAAAPIADPWTGQPLGIVDVSGPARAVHPTEVALVEMAARLAGYEVAEKRRAALDRLRARAAPLLAKITGDVMVVDADGHVAAASGRRTPDRVQLPDHPDGERIWLPNLGPATAEPLPGGWLLRFGEEGDVASVLELDLTGEPVLHVRGASGDWSHRLTRRHAEILVALVAAGPSGRAAAELAEDLFADPTRTVTVRAEMSRLRRDLGAVLQAQPYRVTAAARLLLPPDRSQVLPGSSAPAVLALRHPPPPPPSRR